MFSKELYLKIKLFLHAKKELINKSIIVIMVVVLAYLFVNIAFFEKFVLGKAYKNQVNEKYNAAITFYSFAGWYYGLNHYSETNKTYYLKIPYKLSICYLKKNNKPQSELVMINAKKSIQKEYGLYSKENATFLRNSLVDYYIINKNIYFAQKEFSGLVNIYRKIGYDKNIMADLNRMSGDINYLQGNNEQALSFYETAYYTISRVENKDYDVLVKTVDSLCQYKMENRDISDAIAIYQETIRTLQIGQKKELRAEMMTNLGNAYAERDETLKDAIDTYEKAIELIKTLPRTSYLRQNLTIYYTNLRDLYSRSGQSKQASEIDMELARRRRFGFS